MKKIKYLAMMTVSMLALMFGLKWRDQPAEFSRRDEAQVEMEDPYKSPMPTKRIVDDSFEEKTVKEISDGEIEDELSSLREKIEGRNLIERLNKNSVPHEEREEAARWFERMTALGVERAERKFLESREEFGKLLLEARVRLDEAEDLLGKGSLDF